MKQTIDNFSTGSAEYASFRPDSPPEIFDLLYSHTKCFDTAWDCGTGNGQVAVKLAERFKHVHATDISSEQLRAAVQKNNITYCQERAEATSLPAGSVDLVTVAQAIHWFDFDKFYDEVRRVAKPNAVIAAWTYVMLTSTPEVTKAIHDLYWEVTRKYWDKERDYVDEEYKTIPFPFEEIATPEFAIKRQLSMNELLGYIRTWSGVKHYISQERKDPVLSLIPALEKAWGSVDKLEFTWPVHVRAGYVR